MVDKSGLEPVLTDLLRALHLLAIPLTFAHKLMTVPISPIVTDNR